MEDEPVDGPDLDGLLNDLARWAAQSLTVEEAGARSRESWLRQQAESDTSLQGLLIGWAERRAWVRLTTVAGTVNLGMVAAVGRDFVLLRVLSRGNDPGGDPSAGASAVLVRTSAIASVGRTLRQDDRRARSTETETAPARQLAPPIDLAGALAGLAAERPRLRIATGLSCRVVGELRWVGSDVACLILDGTPPAPVYVPLRGVVEVAILSS
jgi:hypothetical protein